MMLQPSILEPYLRGLRPDQLQDAINGLLPPGATRDDRIAAIETALDGPSGPLIRSAMARWIVDDVIPPKSLLPEGHARWRPVVGDAMRFVMEHLSAPRLAPRLLEQVELPRRTRPEVRLLRLISKVPGLQKLGQVVARNRHLRPALRRALAELENGIHDVNAAQICAFVEQQIGDRLRKFAVEIEPKVLSEASVSAVVRFTWRNPRTGARERGVFKVLKPHIPACFGEDMDLLQRLTEFFSAKLDEYGFAANALPDTFAKVRQLLQHEVDFVGEQTTLGRVGPLYRSVPGVRVPQVIRPLCAPAITALSEEPGVKITDAVAGMSTSQRARVADQLIEAVVAVPLFTSQRDAIFHADPHAGNLLYDVAGGQIVLLDWALTERLTRAQRRYLALLLSTIALRDPVGVWNAVAGLRQPVQRSRSRDASLREFVAQYVDELPLAQLPGGVDAMRLLEHLTVKGMRFPAALIMLSKVLFTLDGILNDIVGADVNMGFSFARHLARRWTRDRGSVDWPLGFSDWLSLQCSALLYPSRVCVKWQEAVADRLLRAAS